MTLNVLFVSALFLLPPILIVVALVKFIFKKVNKPTNSEVRNTLFTAQ